MRAERNVLLIAMAIAFATSARAQTAPARVLGARAVHPTVAIKAWNPAGSIRFVAWDRDSVVVRGTVARDISFILNGDSASVKVVAEARTSADTTATSDLVVYIPRRSTVSAKTVTADITADGASGWFYSVSGSIRLSGRASSVDAQSMNGNLDMNVVTPWIKARTGRGNLVLRGEPEDADVSTITGALSIATSSVLRGQFASVSGDIHYAATPSPRAILDFSSHSGAVDLLMPGNVSASLTLSSISGSIENGFASVRPTAAARQPIKVNLGRGDAQMTVRTFRGMIRLRSR